MIPFAARFNYQVQTYFENLTIVMNEYCWVFSNGDTTSSLLNDGRTQTTANVGSSKHEKTLFFKWAPPEITLFSYYAAANDYKFLCWRVANRIVACYIRILNFFILVFFLLKSVHNNVNLWNITNTWISKNISIYIKIGQ